MDGERKFFRRRYRFSETIRTNISKDYLTDSGSNWTEWEMFRESVQNMWDEADRTAKETDGDSFNHFRIYLKDDNIVLEDKGSGVDLEAILYLGESGKRGTEFRGQKGEGELISFLIACQFGIEKWMLSKNWAVTARFENLNGYNVLVLDKWITVKPSTLKGTRWIYPESSVGSYYRNREDYFPGITKRGTQREKTLAKERAKQLARQEKKEGKPSGRTTSAKSPIFTPRRGGAKLYVKDIYVRDLDSLFSYNLPLELNRDRNMVSELDLFPMIAKTLNSEDATNRQLDTYWREGVGSRDHNKLEYRCVFESNWRTSYRWQNAFYRVFGKDAVIPVDNLTTDLDAATLGAKIIHLNDAAKKWAESVGINTTRNFLGCKEMKLVKKHGPALKSLLAFLREIGKRCNMVEYPIKVAHELTGTYNGMLLGLWKDGEVYLTKAVICDNAKALLKTYFHEVAHGDSGESDGTRGFTNWFESMHLDALFEEPKLTLEDLNHLEDLQRNVIEELNWETV